MLKNKHVIERHFGLKYLPFICSDMTRGTTMMLLDYNFHMNYRYMAFILCFLDTTHFDATKHFDN